MFAYLLLVAIFSSSLPFYNEAQIVPKCDETLIKKIYDYWNKNGGIPQRLIERNIKWSEREIAVLSTLDLVEKDVTCFVIRHFADSYLAYALKGNNVTYIGHEIIREHFGQVFEPLSMDRACRFEIAQCGGAKLVYLCSRNPEAKAGNNWFMIRGVEGKVTKEGCDVMKELLVTFGYMDTLRTFDEKCPVPNEEPLIGSLCDGNSCTAHKQ